MVYLNNLIAFQYITHCISRPQSNFRYLLLWLLGCCFATIPSRDINFSNGKRITLFSQLHIIILIVWLQVFTIFLGEMGWIYINLGLANLLTLLLIALTNASQLWFELFRRFGRWVIIYNSSSQLPHHMKFLLLRVYGFRIQIHLGLLFIFILETS